jgi:hypothetical protein
MYTRPFQKAPQVRRMDHDYHPKNARTLIKSAALAGALFSMVVNSSALASDFLGGANLIDISMGSSRSRIALDMSIGGYELADGTQIDFEGWYTPSFPDISFTFLSEITPSLGLAWGVSIGERGEKYTIDPGLWLGVIYRVPLDRHASLVFSALTMVGGNFRESSCLADYGGIGGVQRVNCRLAATQIPPADTLQFLVNVPGTQETRFSLRYEVRF